MKTIYLDYAAATPMDAKVTAAMQPYFSQKFHNPSSIYLAGRAANRALEDARGSIAQNLGAKPVEIIFTAGATEANNLAIQGVMKDFPECEVLVSTIEHESVLAPAAIFNYHMVPVDSKGRVDLQKLETMVSDKTVLVSIGLVNNEIGTVQAMPDISKILNKLRKLRGSKGRPLYLHSDCAQAPNYFDLHVSRLGVDLLTINGGKIYGPKQSGALYIRAGVQLQPLILGGGQESNLRSGTENVAGAAGLATALSLAQKKRSDEAKRMAKLRQQFIAGLEKNIPVAIVNGSAKHSAPHIVSVTFPDVDNERLMMELDERGIQVATGSACSASSDEPSHVLSAIGLSDKTAHSTLRFSFGRATSEADIAQTLRILRELTS